MYARLCQMPHQKYLFFTYENADYFPIQRQPGFLSHFDWKISYGWRGALRVLLACD